MNSKDPEVTILIEKISRRWRATAYPSSLVGRILLIAYGDTAQRAAANLITKFGDICGLKIIIETQHR